MASKIKGPPPADYDENPEWTAADFAKARPAAEVLRQELYQALTKNRGAQKTPTKKPVSIRLSPSVLDYYKAQGTGWQTKLNADLEGLVAKKRA